MVLKYLSFHLWWTSNDNIWLEIPSVAYLNLASRMVLRNLSGRICKSFNYIINVKAFNFIIYEGVFYFKALRRSGILFRKCQNKQSYLSTSRKWQLEAFFWKTHVGWKTMCNSALKLVFCTKQLFFCNFGLLTNASKLLHLQNILKLLLLRFFIVLDFFW